MGNTAFLTMLTIQPMFTMTMENVYGQMLMGLIVSKFIGVVTLCITEPKGFNSNIITVAVFILSTKHFKIFVFIQKTSSDIVTQVVSGCYEQIYPRATQCLV